MTPELCAVEAHGESRRTGDPQRGPHAGRAASRRREELVNLTWLREGGPRPRKTRPPFYETSREGTTRGTEAAGSCLGRREAGTDSLETSGWWVRGMHRAAHFQTSANCPEQGICLNLNKEGPGLYTPCASHRPSRPSAAVGRWGSENPPVASLHLAPGVAVLSRPREKQRQALKPLNMPQILGGSK